MLSNELRKGDVVHLKGTGWRATIADNARGNIRMADVVRTSLDGGVDSYVGRPTRGGLRGNGGS